MATTTELAGSRQNFLNVPLNVGVQGGDLPARYYSTAVVLALSIAAAPPVALSPGTLMISALLASMSGTILLMAGLVFSQKTHYAGLILIPAPFLLAWLVDARLAWVAVFLGLVLVGWGVQNLVTKRCGVNKLLGLNSCRS